MLVYQYPEIIRISYEPENGLFVHEWLDYSPEDQDDTILQVLQKIYELFVEYEAEKVLVLVDQTKGVFSPQIQNYIREVQFPRIAADTKVKFVATVVRDDEFQKVTAKIWSRPLLKHLGLESRDFADEREARAWLDSV